MPRRKPCKRGRVEDKATGQPKAKRGKKVDFTAPPVDCYNQNGNNMSTMQGLLASNSYEATDSEDVEWQPGCLDPDTAYDHQMSASDKLPYYDINKILSEVHKEWKLRQQPK